MTEDVHPFPYSLYLQVNKICHGAIETEVDGFVTSRVKPARPRYKGGIMKKRPIEAGESFQEDRLSGSSGLAKAFPPLDNPS